MAKIKTVSVQALMPHGIHKYFRWATFTTYEADNGKKLYTIDGTTPVERDEGNKKYLEYAHAEEFKRSESIVETTDAGIIERLEKGIDPYVDYIDNGDQWRAAVARNRRISEFIDTFKKLAAEIA
jgi:hypothetical protein